MSHLENNPLIFNLSNVPLSISSLAELENPLTKPPRLIKDGLKKEVVQRYTCMICQEVYINPVTTTCICAATMCEVCFKRNNRKCPICRKFTDSVPNTEILTILSHQEIVCKCGKKYRYGSKADHDPLCKHAQFRCDTCKQSFNGPEMTEHIKSVHSLQLIMIMAKPVSY
jgi:hypothetical protein